MAKNILVTYASKYGATKEIAERIGNVLLQADLLVEVLPVESVGDMKPYEAVVLGSSIYVGKWQKEAVEFLQANEKALAERHFWLFSSGPTGEGDPLKLVEGKLLPDNIKPVVDRIHPREITVFNGNIDPEKINAIEKWAIKSLVKKPMGDFRNWGTITHWAGNIAGALKDSK